MIVHLCSHPRLLQSPTLCPPNLKVIIEGHVATRDALTVNEKLMELAINKLGSRVGVDVLNLHLTALYEYMDIPIPGFLS